MSQAWALSLPLEAAERVAALRQWPGVECCTIAPLIWLRGGAIDEPQQRVCRSLPGARRFTVLEDGQLLPVGAAVPRGWLPKGPWQRLDQWLKLELPPTIDAGRLPAPTALRLVRSSQQREPNWLLTSLDAWVQYAATAPKVRLARWSFAADRHARVLVRGAPLAPLAGGRLVEADGIVVPAGWTLAPLAEAAVIRRVLGLAAGEFAVWSQDGSWRRIAADDFVQATRSAVRLTHQELCRDA